MYRVLYSIHGQLGRLDTIPVASFPKISLTYSARMLHSSSDVGCSLHMSMRYKATILN